ncbi:sensor histidine kinase [Clostridium sp. 19966]|uniref:cache domain-containing sensor histidine kinase n=1 Tax=Clostridium sp. 19966 TaxID=2768166 RepID=UPI0028DDE609|nr:sensor histidine kinase [Clostridium sp. 19966]MDT8715526.1 sensor histidine kinase [Clostridium sp. 19966]
MRELILRFYRNISLRNKLLLLFCIQIIIPIIFIGYTSYHRSSMVINEKSFNYSQDILKMIDMRIGDLCHDIDSLSMQILYDNRIYEFLKQGYNGKDSTYYSNYNYTQNILRDSVLSRSGIESICMYTPNNDCVYFDGNTQNTSIREKLPYNFVRKAALSANGNNCWVLYKIDNSDQDIYAARIIYNRDDFKPIGMIAILINREYIKSLYEELSKEGTNNISILSANNEEIIGSSGDKTYLSMVNEKGYAGGSGHYIDNKNKLLISYVVLNNPDWRIVYHRPLKEIYKDINDLRIKIIIFVIWSILGLSLLSRITAFDIVTPIDNLVEAMKRVEKGDSYKEAKVEREDEIGYLFRSFNNMAKRIDYLLNSIYKEKITRKDAEIKALQAQINPHFLFNTLENINWMAQLNGVPEISNTVTALSKLMEANMGKGDKLVNLSEEFAYVENYFEIMKYRLEDRLTIEKNIQQETLEIKIPKLLVEPIVENSLIHGIENVRRQGKVVLNSFLDSEEVVIEVIDNGIGMKEKELEKLLEDIEGEESSTVIERIGLSNVNKRIKLFYGEKYGLKVQSEYDKYTKVTIRIPANNIKGDNYYV